MDTIIQNINGSTTDQLTVLATALFQNMFGMKELNLDIGVEFQTNLETFITNSQNQLSSSGGNFFFFLSFSIYNYIHCLKLILIHCNLSS